VYFIETSVSRSTYRKVGLEGSRSELGVLEYSLTRKKERLFERKSRKSAIYRFFMGLCLEGRRTMMPTTAARKRQTDTPRLLAQLALTTGGSFLGASFGGFLTQYINNNPSGMMVFAVTGFVGLVFVVMGSVCLH
jgi:hypothetical protein